MMIKTRPGICPYCGDCNVEYCDSDEMYDNIYYDCHCNHCDKDFTERFQISYDGFTDDTGAYDKNGVKIK